MHAVLASLGISVVIDGWVLVVRVVLRSLPPGHKPLPAVNSRPSGGGTDLTRWYFRGRKPLFILRFACQYPMIKRAMKRKIAPKKSDHLTI